MKPSLLSFCLSLVLMAWGTQASSQDCNAEVLVTLTTQLWGGEISYTISDDNGPLATGDGFTDYGTFTTTFCADDISGCLVLEMNDSFGDGWNGAFLDINLPFLGISLGTFTLEEGAAQAVTFGEGCDVEVVDIEGCTDPFAFNYDPTATIDDGSYSYDCECDDVYEPVCGYDYLTGEYVTFNNLCEAECAQAWVINEGDCGEQPIYGCTDEEAVNYNPDATDDDGSCVVVPECGEGEFLALASLTTDLWGGETSYTIADDNGVLLEGQGLADYATFEGYFCLADTSTCLVLTMQDSFGDGWNGATLTVTVPDLGVSLGTFTLAVGNVQSITFGLDCETEVVQTEGCTDPFAFNYDPTAIIDDGSCSYDCECEDIDAPVCAFNHITGEYTTFANECEAACAQAWVISEGSCEDLPVYGCTDPEALNFNPDATDDDGSCATMPECGDGEETVLVTLQTEIWGSEVSFVLSDANGVLAEGQGLNDYGTVYATFCLNDSAGCLELEMIDSFGDGWNGASLEVAIPSQNLSLGTFSLETGYHQAISFGLGCETEVIETEGCTDPYAFNYDPYATIDDGSCSYECECEDVYDPVCGYDYLTGEYVTFNNACEASCAQVYIVWDGDCADQPIYGCTDPEAVNFNPDATYDDGSCVVIPTCGPDQTAVTIEVNQSDTLSELGIFFSVYWNLIDEAGMHVDLVYDYSQWEAATAYGCLDDGCYNFYMSDYGWEPGLASVNVTLGDETTTYGFPEGQIDAAYAIGVNAEDCEVFIPVYGCMDSDALNYNPDANVDDGYCLYPCECDDVYDPVCAYDSFTGDYVTFNNPCEAECWNAWIVWDGDCSEQPIFGCTDPEALNYNPDATDDDGSCAFVPTCDNGEVEVVIQSLATDSLDEFGTFVSLYWSLTTDLGGFVNLVTDYNEFQTTSYGCLADGCYNFYVNDFGWTPGTGTVEVTLDGEPSTYSLPADEFSAVFALGVNTDGCEVTVPGCTDVEALNYNPSATVDDGTCQYPFICETGEVGYVYLYASASFTALNILSEQGELVFSQEDAFNFGGVYGEVCLEPNVCYTAIVSGDLNGELGWNDGAFGVSTNLEDIAYAEWPLDEGIWAVQFGLNGACAEGEFDWESYLGCTDPEASNYNPEALVNDGSCLFENLCDGMFEVEFVLDGGLMPDDVALNVSNDEGDLLMEMDGYTGSSVGCVPAGCYTVEMIDAIGDGWNGAMAELFVDGESVETMTLENGAYELRVFGLGMDCETPDNGGDGTSLVEDASVEPWTLELFPNPGHNALTIRSQFGGELAPPSIRVFSADGRLMADACNEVPGTTGDWLIDASSWTPGLYVVHASQRGQTQQLTWIKLH